MDDLHRWLDEEYSKALENPMVKDPAAYATYKLWRRADSIYKKKKEANHAEETQSP